MNFSKVNKRYARLRFRPCGRRDTVGLYPAVSTSRKTSCGNYADVILGIIFLAENFGFQPNTKKLVLNFLHLVKGFLVLYN